MECIHVKYKFLIYFKSQNVNYSLDITVKFFARKYISFQAVNLKTSEVLTTYSRMLLIL